MKQGHRRRLLIEFVGVAGVGKSYLGHELMQALGDGCITLASIRRSWRTYRSLPAAFFRAAPLCLYLLVARRPKPVQRARFAMRLLLHAAAEVEAMRHPGPAEIVVADTGWFHKLRRVRQLLDPTTTYAGLPVPVRARLFAPDAVFLLTADPIVVCERKLRRTGQPVNEGSLSVQYKRMADRGQWEEDDFTRRDLAEAAAERGLRHFEIDLHPGFDVAEDLVPLLQQLVGEA